jgi:hypothetical protein
MSARIYCVECGARPFPELGPPGTRQDFDLRKIRGEWRCAQHRDVATDTKSKQASNEAGLESLLAELGRLVANMGAEIVKDDDGEEYADDYEDERERALELVDRIGAGIARARAADRVQRP